MIWLLLIVVINYQNITYHYRMLLIDTSHYWPLPTTTNTSDHYIPLLTITDHYWLLLTTTYHYIPLQTSVDHNWLQLTTPDHYWPLLTTCLRLYCFDWDLSCRSRIVGSVCLEHGSSKITKPNMSVEWSGLST